VVENPRKTALTACDANYQQYAAMAENMRASRYLATLPKLDVGCAELDGDASNLPVIFEDVYRHDEEVDGYVLSEPRMRRRHSLSDVADIDLEMANQEPMDETKRAVVKRRELMSGSLQVRGAKKATARPISVPFVVGDLSKAAVDAPINNSGFSHLEWSASVPYNMAEEPDEVAGMKHSHSCQSMPTVAQLKVRDQSKTSPDVKESEKGDEKNALPQKAAGCVNGEGISKTSQKDHARPKQSPAKNMTVSIRTREADAPKNNHSGSSSSSAAGTPPTATEMSKARLARPSLQRQHSQAELTRKLDEVRRRSRSTILVAPGLLKTSSPLTRSPRARSEEGSAEAARQPRQRRLHSEGQELQEEETRVSNGLSAPGLLRSAMGKSLPSPPEQFRDEGGDKKTADPARDPRRERALRIQRDLEERIHRRKSKYEEDQRIQRENGEITTLPARKPKPDKRAEGTASMSRAEAMAKRCAESNSHCMVVERTGDCLETKELPKRSSGR